MCVCVFCLPNASASTDCDLPHLPHWLIFRKCIPRASKSESGSLPDRLEAFSRTDGFLVNEKWHTCEMLRETDTDWLDGLVGVWMENMSVIWLRPDVSLSGASFFFFFSLSLSLLFTTQTVAKWKTMSAQSAINQNTLIWYSESHSP